MNMEVLRTVSHDGLTPAVVPIPTEEILRTMSKASSTKGDVSTWKVEDVEQKFETDRDQGLSSAKAAEILTRDGLNELHKPPNPSLLMLFTMQMVGFIIILLMVAAFGSVLVNATGSNKEDPLAYTTGVAIVVLVLINAGIAAWTEHQAGGALDALAKMSQATISVIRDGQEQTIATTSVVRGDIVVLGTGDVVPADVRLVTAEDLKVSEMCLTGEPEDVSKTFKLKVRKEGEAEKLTPENMVFSGCSTTNGRAKGIVVDTGMSTRIGEIAALMAGEKGQKKQCGCLPDTSASQTPLQRNVQELGKKIGVLAIFVCIAVFFIGVALDTKDPDNLGDESSSLLPPTVMYMILISVTLAVAAIPEGIPLCVTISLSIGCSEMVKKNVLVRKLAAVETLGSASVICSDKTGTLTEGKMTMVQMWSGGVQYDVSGKGFDPTVGKFTRKNGVDANTDAGVMSTLFSAMLCSNTTVAKVCDPDSQEQKWEPRGNSSEAPIIVAGMKVGLTTDKLEAEYKRVLEIPFSSTRKMMLTVSDVDGKTALGTVGESRGASLPQGSKFLTVCKGAPNFILDICTSWTDGNGERQAMTSDKKEEITKIVDEYSSQALRVLAVAVRPMSQLPFDPLNEDLNADDKFAACRQELQLVGLVASIDPDRDGVKESVERARGAGIRVVMITGDYLKTAAAIAKNVNILMAGDDEQACAVDCKSLRPVDDRYLSESDIDLLTKQTKVFARAKPEDKLEIVKSLQRQGLVCAMTGDGVNDAPALNQADIGVAMGIQGTEVAKGASDMILTDDNFCSIVEAVEKGRTIYAGIQKFVAFIMSVHIAEVIQIFVCIVAGIPVMRTPLQILFLILVTDLPPSIALGMEPGDKSILKVAPRPKEEPIVLGWMWMNINMNGLILSAVIITVYLFALQQYVGEIFLQDIIALNDYEENLSKARTVAFISLVFSENIRAYISRSFDRPVWVNFFGNRNMQWAILAAQVALYFAVLVPGVSDKILGLRGLDIGWWGWLVALTGPIATLVLCELAKIITKWQMHRYQASLRTRQAAAEEKGQTVSEEQIKTEKLEQPLAGAVVQADI